MIRGLCTVALLAFVQPAYADTIGVKFAGGFTTLTDFETVIGWRFTANADLRTGALGMWDEGADGFTDVAEVGLWTADGALLGSTTVSSADRLADGFRFASIAPVLLTGGDSYVVAGLLRAPDYYRAFTTVTNSPFVTWDDSRAVNTPVLTFPTEFTGRSGSYFGANLEVAPVHPVPEAGTLTLLAMGIAGIVASGLRRRRL